MQKTMRAYKYKCKIVGREWTVCLYSSVLLLHKPKLSLKHAKALQMNHHYTLCGQHCKGALLLNVTI